MGLGLIFPGLLAIWITMRSQSIDWEKWHLNRIAALAIIFTALILCYFDIPLRKVYLNLGGAFVFIFSCWLFFFLSATERLKSLFAALVIAGMVFFIKSGMLWQVEQFINAALPLVALLSMIISAATGSYAAALSTAGLGVELAGLVWTFGRFGEMGLPFFNLYCIIAAGAWLLLYIMSYLKKRQLTKSV